MLLSTIIPQAVDINEKLYTSQESQLFPNIRSQLNYGIPNHRLRIVGRKEDSVMKVANYLAIQTWQLNLFKAISSNVSTIESE